MRFDRNYNLKDENIIGRSHYKIFPEISERWKEIHRRCLAGATEKEEQDPFPRADGTLDWVRWKIHPWYEKSGEIGGIILFSEVVTERIQAEREIKQRTEDLLLINALNDAANRGEEMDGITQMFAHETRSMFNCQDVNIYLISPDAQYIEMQSTTVSRDLLDRIEKLIGRSIPNIRIPLNESSFFKELLAIEQGMLTCDKKMLERWLAEYTETTYLPASLRSIFKKLAPQILKIMNIRSVISIPLISSGQTIGLMDMTSRELLTDETHQRARNLSYQVTAVLLRKQAEKQVQLQLRRMSALGEIDRAISSGLDMRLLLGVVLNQVLSQLDVDAASILLLNPFSQMLEYVAGKGYRTQNIRQSRMRLGDGLAGRVGLERKVLHVPDLTRIGDQFIRAKLLKEDEFVEYFGVPLIVKGMLKGVLEIFHRAPLSPDLEWLNYLETLGGQAAIAIENAQLFDSLQRSNADLEERVKIRTSDLLRVNTELEQANHAKNEFLATMSHELRTPLTGILGLSEAMQLNTYGELNEKQIKVLQNIEASGRHLLELINDILDLSKIEANKFDIYPEMISLEDACRASLVFVKEQAQKKSVLLKYQPAENVKSVLADPRRLKQMLANLLSNAVKFTPEKGKVTLAVNADAEKGQIHISVTDTGIGIAPEDLERLFTPFTQVDSRLNRQYEGTGLGLVLVLRLAEMHGGSIQVESEVGKGSCFTVSLPWQPQVTTHAEIPVERNQGQVPAALEPNSRGVLLLVEDNTANIEVVGDYLQFKGYTLVVASNGVEALVKAEENNPQLILMDIQMPGMDGLEATRRLRADPRFVSTPIIALTALAMPGDRERCLKAGANEYMSKPLELKGLLVQIEKLLDQDTKD